MTTTDARLAFIFPEQEPGITPAPASRPASRPEHDPGPSLHHKLAGGFPLGPGVEMRITWQPARDADRPARLMMRPWRQHVEDGSWWPISDKPGIVVSAKDARAFGAAVAAACAALEAEHAT